MMNRKTTVLISCAFSLLFAGVCVFAEVIGGRKADPTPPPVERVEGIKITNCSLTGIMLSLDWETEDERIAEGDTYRVEVAKREVTNRLLGKKTYGNYELLTTTTEKSLRLPVFLVGRDVKLRVSVYKEAEQ